MHALRLPRHHTTIEFYEKDITLLQLFPKPFHEERPRIELTNNLHSGLEISSTSHGFFLFPDDSVEFWGKADVSQLCIVFCGWP